MASTWQKRLNLTESDKLQFACWFFFMLITLSRQAAVPYVTVQLPLTTLLLPDDHVLAPIYNITGSPAACEFANLNGGISVALGLNGLEPYCLHNFPVHSCLPRCLDSRPSCNKIAAGRQKLPIFCIKIGQSSCIPTIEGCPIALSKIIPSLTKIK